MTAGVATQALFLVFDLGLGSGWGGRGERC